MDELENCLRECLANTFVMYFKAHAYHWNVEGALFSQYHDFFGGLYEEIHGAVDGMAEELRTLDVYAPGSLTELYKSSTVSEDPLFGTDIVSMLNSLLMTNSKVIECLNRCLALATARNKQGLVDFLANRIDVHNKHGWMLKSSLKGIQ